MEEKLKIFAQRLQEYQIHGYEYGSGNSYERALIEQTTINQIGSMLAEILNEK